MTLRINLVLKVLECFSFILRKRCYKFSCKAFLPTDRHECKLELYNQGNC
eukprot:m.9683 g.9683  ORF g.9683 m.9683 type:complete len:50 (+) comp3518_c0_seq1:1202-1351(+)